MQRYNRREPGRLRRAYASRTARLMSEFEKRALRDFDAHITVSQRDAERLRTISPDARIFVIENGVDIDFYSDLGANDESLRGLVFGGSVDYHAHIDAAVGVPVGYWPPERRTGPR